MKYEQILWKSYYKLSEWRVVVRSLCRRQSELMEVMLPGNTGERLAGVSGCLGILFHDLQVKGRMYGYL